jgi:hypothetical protein
MKITKNALLGLLFVIGLIIFCVPDVVAQCAMCRASVESNAQNGNTGSADNLNSGILYLMCLPYILFSVVGFFWYRNTKMKKQKPKLATIRPATL